jgi:hypothetical protein
MNYKGPPRVLEVIEEKVSERVTNLMVAIGMGDIPNLPILLTPHVANTLINSTFGVNISHLSSEKRLEVAQCVLQELGYSMIRTMYDSWTILQERRIAKNNVPKERTTRFNLGLPDIQYMSFENGQIHRQFMDRCRMVLSVSFADFVYFSSEKRLEVAERILEEL